MIQPSSVLEHVVSVDMSMYVDSRIVLYIVIRLSHLLEHVVSVDMSMYVQTYRSIYSDSTEPLTGTCGQ